MALTAESGELLELFQWLTPEESSSVSDADRQAVAGELADILIYAIRLADILQIDIGRAIADKIEANEVRYPVEQSRRRAERSSSRTPAPMPRSHGASTPAGG
jgi:NTP pyrophosphatase (non-canonical NTP hydrolase)